MNPGQNFGNFSIFPSNVVAFLNKFSKFLIKVMHYFVSGEKGLGPSSLLITSCISILNQRSLKASGWPSSVSDCLEILFEILPRSLRTSVIAEFKHDS